MDGGGAAGCHIDSAAVGDQHWETLHSEVRRGEVVPLETHLDWLEANYLGDVLEVEVEREQGLVEYESTAAADKVKWLSLNLMVTMVS